MATLNTTYMTLSDIAKQTDPGGGIASVVELLSQRNEILDDIPWVQGNLKTGHRTTLRTKLPDVYTRRLNQGTRISKAGNNQIDEQTTIIEGWSEVDQELLRLSDNPAQTRLNEDSAFVESMNQKCSELFIYGSQANDPSEINGLHQRMGVLGANDASQIIDAGGTGSDNTSIWLVVWDPNSVHGIYNKNGLGGLRQHDWGEAVVEGVDGSNNPTRMVVARTQFIWELGLCVRDYRQIVRIANIDVSNTVSESGAADLIKLMIRAMSRVNSLSAGRPVFYMNRTLMEALQIQQLDRVANSTLRMGEIYGRETLMVRSYPVRCIDRILNTEARIV